MNALVPRRLDRAAAALFLIPAALWLLYEGWTGWNGLLRDLLSFLPREDRGFVRGLITDYRLLIEVLIVFFVAGLIERFLSIFPRAEDPAH